MTVAYPNIADRLFGRAHAIEPNALRAIVEGPIGQRVLAGERIELKPGKKADRAARAGRVSAMIESEPVRGNDGMSEYALTRDGVAIMSISGALSKRFDWLAAACGFTTYEALGASLDSALADYRVKAILLDVDSPGGSVDGMLDLADKILAARSKVKIWAVANSVAASAAYALAGSAGKLYLPRLAMIGSIGAVMMHVDRTAQDKAMGLKYSAIYSGNHKVDGWDHASLSAEARTWMQARVDHCRQSLCDLIGRQGRISAEAALATEASVYSDSEGVKAGLADGVATFEETLAALTAEVKRNPQSSTEGTSAMTTQKDASPAAIVTTQAAPASPATAAAAPGKTDAAATAAPAAAPAAQAAKPAAGEKCSCCGQTMPSEDDADAKTKAAGAAAAGTYTIEMAMETMDLCAIAKVPVSEAKAFVAAKTPIAAVRAQLTARAAAASDALAVDGTARPASSSEANVAASWDSVTEAINKQFGVAKK